MESSVNAVAALIEKVAKRKESRSTDVVKAIELSVDEGNLFVVDKNPLELSSSESHGTLLKEVARDGCQALVNSVWQLSKEVVDDVIVVALPPGRTTLPREKPVPKARPLTKWQQYAQLKGIQNRKRTRKLWDEQHKEWRPRWGYKRVDDPKEKWVLEVPDNADPYEDQFEKMKKEKRERIAKNELQRLRNIARSTGKRKVPAPGLEPTAKPDPPYLASAFHTAGRATASLGRFQQKVHKEGEVKVRRKKRKFEPNLGDMAGEKRRTLDIVDRISAQKPTLDVEKAVSQHVKQASRRGDDKPERKPKSKKRSKEGSKGSRGRGPRQQGKQFRRKNKKTR